MSASLPACLSSWLAVSVSLRLFQKGCDVCLSVCLSVPLPEADVGHAGRGVCLSTSSTALTLLHAGRLAAASHKVCLSARERPPALLWLLAAPARRKVCLCARREACLCASACPAHALAGHSQGTAVALAAMASWPALQDRISLAVLLAPVAFVTHITSRPVLSLAQYEADKVQTGRRQTDRQTERPVLSLAQYEADKVQTGRQIDR
jgi:hypothetical protein